MAIMRRYECGDCGCKFEKLHFDRNEPTPECPGCQALAAKQLPSGFSIGGGTHSKAIDITQSIVEKDFGMTDMRDNIKEGETAAMPVRADLRPAVDNMWRPSGDIIAAAKAGAAAAAAEGRNPVAMMHKVGKAHGPAHRVPVSVVAKG